MKKKIILTNNKEIYDKLIMLNFSNEVILKSLDTTYIDKILKNINKEGNKISMEKVGEYLILKKLNPINFSIYYRNKNG